MRRARGRSREQYVSEISPRASTMRMVAAESTRKCWPSLGLLRGFSAAAIFAKLTHFPAGKPAFRLSSCSAGCPCAQSML